MNRCRKHDPRPVSRPFNPELDDDIEPTAHQYEAARIALGAWASDDQVTRMAFDILDAEILDSYRMAEEDMADSRRDWE